MEELQKQNVSEQEIQVTMLLNGIMDFIEECIEFGRFD